MQNCTLRIIEGKILPLAMQKVVIQPGKSKGKWWEIIFEKGGEKNVWKPETDFTNTHTGAWDGCQTWESPTRNGR